LVFDERSQAFGRVVPLRRDLVEVPLCSLQAFFVQVPDPLTPPAGVAHEPRTPECVEVARNRLTRHPGPFTETSNGKGLSGGQRTWSPVVAGLSDTTVAAWQPSTTVLADGSLAFSYFTAAAVADGLGGTYPTSVRVARVRLANDGTVLERHESPVLDFPWQPGPRKQGMFLGDYHSLLVVGQTLCPLFARSFGPSSQIALACASGAAHLRP